MKPPRGDAVLYRVGVKAETEELLPRDDPVLGRRKLPGTRGLRGMGVH